MPWTERLSLTKVVIVLNTPLSSGSRRARILPASRLRKVERFAVFGELNEAGFANCFLRERARHAKTRSHLEQRHVRTEVGFKIRRELRKTSRGGEQNHDATAQAIEFHIRKNYPSDAVVSAAQLNRPRQKGEIGRLPRMRNTYGGRAIFVWRSPACFRRGLAVRGAAVWREVAAWGRRWF